MLDGDRPAVKGEALFVGDGFDPLAHRCFEHCYLAREVVFLVERINHFHELLFAVEDLALLLAQANRAYLLIRHDEPLFTPRRVPSRRNPVTACLV